MSIRGSYLGCLPTLYQSLGLGILLSWALPVLAMEQNKTNNQTSSKTFFFEDNESVTVQQALQTLEAWQSHFGATLDDYVGNIDRFLGDAQLEVARKQSRFRLYFPTVIDQNGSVSTDVKFRASVDLPRSKNRWQIMISSFDETSIDNPDNQSPGTILKEFEQADKNRQTRSEVSLSVQRSFLKDLQQQIKFRVGLKFQGVLKPNPYMRLNYYSSDRLASEWLRSSTHNIILEHIRGFVLESRQSFSKPMPGGDLFKSQTTGVWLHRDKTYHINQRFTWFERISSHRFYAYFLDGNWELTEDSQRIDNAAIGFNWREKLYKDWLFAELEPRVTWYHDEKFRKVNPSVLLQLEMHFYR